MFTVVALQFLVLRVLVPSQEVASAAESTIYDDALVSGWRDRSRGSTVNFAGTPGYNSQAAISWTVKRASGRLRLRTEHGVTTDSSTRLHFALRPSQANLQFWVALYDDTGKRLGQRRLSEMGGNAPAGAWKAYDIDLAGLSAASKTVGGFQLRVASKSPRSSVLVDSVKLVTGSTRAPTPTPTSSPVATSTAAPTATPTATATRSATPTATPVGTPVAPHPEGGIVQNSSVEQPAPGNPAVPQSWSTVKSGDNDARFSYLTSGRTGSRSVRVDVTRRASGEAAWAPVAWPVVPGQAYRITHYYRSEGRTWAVATVRKADGTTEHVGRKQAAPYGEWAQYLDSFIAPPRAVSLSVSHVIGSAGYLVTDDYSVTPYAPRPFSRALVSLTFDDGYKGQVTSAWPLLRRYGMSATFFISTGLLSSSATYMAPADVAALARDGAHIATHTVTHPDLTALSAQQVADELSRSQQYLENLLGLPVADFASPQGRYGGPVLGQIRQVYRSHRSTVTGYNLRDTLDPYAIQVQNVYLTTTEAEVRSWVQRARRDRSWLVLVYHRVDGSGDRYSLTAPALEHHLAIIQAEGLAVETLDTALREATAQP